MIAAAIGAALMLVFPAPGGAIAAPGVEIAARARAIQPGELVVLTITTPDAVERVRVRAFERDVEPFRVDDHVWRALVGIDLDVKPGTYPVAVTAGAVHATHDLVVVTRVFRTRRLTVNEAFVTPPASEQARIDARSGAARPASGNRRRRRGCGAGRSSVRFRRRANSAFGTRSIFNGKPRNAHGGADFLSPTGTPIHAPNAGRVVVARDLVFLRQHRGHRSWPRAVLDARAPVGDRRQRGRSVTADQVLGLVGATGRVTGPHLHWAVRASGARVDPLSILQLLGAATP